MSDPNAASDQQAEPSKPEKKLNPVELLKEQSQFLRGSIPEELQADTPKFGKDSIQLLKHHGTYQQDNRDQRAELRKQGSKEKAYSMMLRTRLPGGRITADQMLVEMGLGDELGDHTIRLTTRQAIQHHGILKQNLREVIHRINEAKMSTLAACGDVNRNIMYCPAPFASPIHDQLEHYAFELTERLSPKTRSYYELWIKDPESDEKELVGGGPESDVVEPLYGKTYLPRKFKTAIGFCHDNCIDIYTQDLGFLAVIRDDRLLGFNVLVGGGMGTTPAKKDTFPAIAHRMTFIEPEQIYEMAEAVIKVQRDHGNRGDRKTARMKYLIHRWGLPKFKAHVEEYFGQSLPEPDSDDVRGFDDHMGWNEQGDGKWFYGLNIENGRVADTADHQMKSAIREICKSFKCDMRVTAHQSLLFTNIEEDAKSELEAVLKSHQVKMSEEFSTVRRWSMACVAWPTCGLAITESERALPSIIDELEVELARLGLDSEAFTLRMTGCPNGCARPYNADVGLVGKAKDRYTLFLGGRLLGNRLGYIYKDLVPRDKVIAELSAVFKYFKGQREENESFGDFCHRIGQEALEAACESSVSAA